MPEGHTIHRLAADLADDLTGHPVSTEVRQARFREGAAALDGLVLDGTDAYGKHLFLHWSNGQTLYVHLGLIGKFRRQTNPPAITSDALRLRLTGADHSWDLTGPMTCTVRDPAIVDEVAAGLGPDPLRPDADAGRFIERVRSSRTAIGTLLLDQSVIAGIGNVYRAEVLFLAGIHPRRAGRSLSPDEADTVWDLCRKQLRLGVKRNRILTVDLAGRRAATISRADAVYVYKREHCGRCSAPVDWYQLSGRTIYSCPEEQAS